MSDDIVQPFGHERLQDMWCHLDSVVSIPVYILNAPKITCGQDHRCATQKHWWPVVQPSYCQFILQYSIENENVTKNEEEEKRHEQTIDTKHTT